MTNALTPIEIQKAKDQHKPKQKFNFTTIADLLGTVRWSNDSHQLVLFLDTDC